MNTRELILRSVRRALEGADRTVPPVSRAYRAVAETAAEGLLDLFAQRVEDYRATVVRCPEAEVAAAVAHAVAGYSPVLVPSGFPWEIPGALTDTGQSPAQLDRVEAVVTGAAVAIATTGTIVLDHGPGQGRRALSLVPDMHVCVVRADQVVLGVADAVSRLDPAKPQTWISGPSATSDIELNRVEGVHGPRRLHLILAVG